MTVKLPHSLAPALSFCLQIVVGAFLFLVVSGVATFLAWVVGAAEQRGLVPPWLAKGTHYIEIAIWGADVAFFILFLGVELVRSSWRLIKGEEVSA